MFSISTTWEAPLILMDDDDWADPFSEPREQIEKNMIWPAQRAIESISIGRYLAWIAMNGVNLPKSEIKEGGPPADYDTEVRFKSHGECESGLLLEHITRYKNVTKEGVITSEINPDFFGRGVIIFARDNPSDAYETKTTRHTERTKDRVIIRLTVDVKIKREDAFRYDWFRLESNEKQ